MSKKLEQKQARRLEQERRKAERRKAALRRNLVTILVAVGVILAVVFAIVSERQTTEAPVGVPMEEANCTEPETFEAQEGQHIKEGSPHAPYNSNPPTSGPHYEIPADPAFYRDPVEPERVVHNLEHGMIVIWYRPDLDQEQLGWVEEIVEDEPAATVGTPYNVDDQYALVATAWLGGENRDDPGQGVLQSCENVSQAAINEFRKDYQGKGPELIAPPFRG